MPKFQVYTRRSCSTVTLADSTLQRDEFSRRILPSNLILIKGFMRLVHEAPPFPTRPVVLRNLSKQCHSLKVSQATRMEGSEAIHFVQKQIIWTTPVADKALTNLITLGFRHSYNVGGRCIPTVERGNVSPVRKYRISRQ